MYTNYSHTLGSKIKHRDGGSWVGFFIIHHSFTLKGFGPNIRIELQSGSKVAPLVPGQEGVTVVYDEEAKEHRVVFDPPSQHYVPGWANDDGNVEVKHPLYWLGEEAGSLELVVRKLDDNKEIGRKKVPAPVVREIE